LKISKSFLLIIALSMSLVLFRAPNVAAFTPHPGDYFSYSETQDVGSGTGNYSTYTDHTAVNGMERMNSVAVNGTVSANYSYAWSWRDNQGSTPETGSSSGNFTYSATSFLYIKGTDNQTGYSGPITVWFVMDNSIPQGGTFYLLDTLMKVKSTSYSYHLASQNKNVNTIFAEGTGYYQRKDYHGIFAATYTWDTYFDPSTGYIVGYTWNEQDTNSSQANGFTYSENLYVDSTSYPLTTAAGTSFLQQYLGLIIGVIIFIVIIVIVAVALSRRRRNLPKHSQQFPPPGQYYRPPPPSRPPQVDLTPKEPPVEQIVIKEVVKVKCRYCGALIDSTVQACPFCGAPRT
jgi:hypothetical protein